MKPATQCVHNLIREGVCVDCGLEGAVNPATAALERALRDDESPDSNDREPTRDALAVICGGVAHRVVYDLKTCRHEQTATWQLAGFDAPTSLEWCAVCGARRVDGRRWIASLLVKGSR